MHATRTRLAIVTLTGLSCPCAIVDAGDVTSIRATGVPLDWTEVGQWTHDNPGVTTFPNNGNEGHTFDVQVLNTSAELDLDITVDTLALQGSIDLAGHTLELLFGLDVVLGSMLGGSVTTPITHVTSTNLTLIDTSLATNDLTLELNSNLVLDGGSNLTVDGTVIFNGDGDINSFDGGLSLVDFSGATISKLGGASTSDITVRSIATDLTLQNLAPNGVLRFNVYEQAWDDVHVVVDPDADVEFDVPITMTNMAIQSPASMFDRPTVTFRKPVDLGGTLSSSGEVNVVVTANFGDGRIPMGTVDCTSLLLESSGKLSGSGEVINEGLVDWKDGRILAPGLRNRDVMVTSNPGLRLLDVGAVVTSETDARIFQDGDRITMAIDSKIINEGEWVIGDLVPETSASSIEVVSAGRIRSGDMGADINVPFEASGEIILDCQTGCAIVLRNATFLHDLAIASPSPDDSCPSLILDGGGVPAGTQLQLSGMIEVSNSGFECSTFEIRSGDYMLDGTIASQFSEILMTGGSLSGGVIDVDGSGTNFETFQQTNSTLGDTAEVQNAGLYRIISGAIGSGGVVNLDRMFIDTGFGSLVRIKRCINAPQGQVFHGGNIVLEVPGVTNQGQWNASANVTFDDPFDSGVFNNTGLFVGQLNQVAIDTFFDNTGTVRADGVEVRFLGTVAQHDPVTGALSAGRWELVNGGSITFGPAEETVETVGPDAAVGLAAAAAETLPTWNDIAVVEGMVEVTSGTVLDLSANASAGVVQVQAGGQLVVGTATPEPPARVIAVVFVNRGRTVLYDASVLQADVRVELANASSLAGDGGVIETLLVENIDGKVEPGVPLGFAEGGAVTTGSLTIDGDYTQGVEATMTIELAGTSDGESDQLVVAGDATLGGALVIELIDGYVPAPNDSFDVLAAASIIGAFDTVSAPAGADVTYLADRVVVTFAGPTCAGDIDMSGAVDTADLLMLLGAWGACGVCPADLNGDGVVDTSDLLALIGAWGACE